MKFLLCLLCLFAAIFPARAQELNPNKTPFPRASQHDFSDLVPAPTGQKGFLTTKGEHFAWSDGSRARFWGINVANTSLQESDANIEAMLRNFRAAGFNLVRLHHFDERGGIIDLDAPDSRRFVEANWRKLDFWIAKARENGLYVYLDLLDYRRFKAGDGVEAAEALGRSAKPYAVFDPKLIELQKEYARKLLREHVNPFTGLRYADDPTVVMLEVYSESGLFMRRGLWRSMPEPYAARFKALWNKWLQAKYGSTINLYGAWTGPNGKSALFEHENLEKGLVELPAMTWEINRLGAKELPYSALPRRSDGARFAYDIHRRYFREMKTYLRQELGVKIPMCVTGRYDDLSDLASQASELDFIGCNFYYDHPYWGGNAPQWKMPSYFHNRNPLTDVGEMSMAATLGLTRVKGKPLVVREWNHCYPNQNRGAGMLEAATFAAMQDIDAMILFTYATGKEAQVGYFNVRSDPTRWGMAAVGARIFLKALVAPMKKRIVVPYSSVDLFAYEKYHQPLYILNWTSRVENDYFEGETYLAPPGTHLIVPPGRSVGSRYSNAPLLFYTRLMRGDLANNPRSVPMWSEYGLAPRLEQVGFGYEGVLYDAFDGQERPRNQSLALDVIRANNLTAVGANEAINAAHGFRDDGRRILAFAGLEREEVAPAALDALQIFGGVTGRRSLAARGVSRSDTNEVVRDFKRGKLAVATPQVQILAGDLLGVSGSKSGLQVSGAKNGALVALSLDGLPLVSSRRYVLKMTADARNVDEKLGRDPRFIRSPNGQWILEAFGRKGVVSDAVATTEPVRIALGGREQLQIWLEGGTWELLVDGQNRKFWCDTPGARWKVLGSDGRVVASSAGTGKVSSTKAVKKLALAQQ